MPDINLAAGFSSSALISSTFSRIPSILTSKKSICFSVFKIPFLRVTSSNEYSLRIISWFFSTCLYSSLNWTSSWKMVDASPVTSYENRGMSSTVRMIFSWPTMDVVNPTITIKYAIMLRLRMLIDFYFIHEMDCTAQSFLKNPHKIEWVVHEPIKYRPFYQIHRCMEPDLMQSCWYCMANLKRSFS